MRPLIQNARMAGLIPQTIAQVLATAPVAVATHLRRFWAVWLAFAAIAVAAGIGLHTGLERLAGRWMYSYAYGHSFLVVPMAAWLLVAGLRDARIDRVGPSALGLAGVFFAVALYALAEIIDLTLGMQVVLPVIIFASILAVAGPQFAIHASAAVAMLYFTIPVWDLLIRPLQDITTWVVTAWLGWSNVIAHIDGYLITVRAGVFEIAEGCSGMRYLMISLTLGAFFGFYWLRRWRNRLLVFIAAGLASMVGNWVRVYTLILLGDWTGMEHYLISESHVGYGWVIFGIFMLPVLWFALWLEAREATPRQRSPSGSVAAVSSAPIILLSGILIAAMVVSPVLLRGGGEAPTEPASVELIPEPAAGWTRLQGSQDWNPAFAAPHIVGRQSLLSSEDVRVDAFMARYLSQQQDSKLISTRNDLGPDWHRRVVTDVSVSINGEPRTVRQLELAAGGSRRLVWTWYLVGGQPAHRELNAKLLEVPALLRGRRDGSVIALSAPCSGTCAGAGVALQRFVEDHGRRMEAVAAGRDGIDP